ncbi:hypothetical protein M432DRAFT_665178 [Thermoascus aurantiacus ATCC 26904]
MTTVLKTRFGDVHVHKEIIQGDFDNIPIIDLAPMGSPDLDERKELAAQIYDACSRNHGVPEELISKLHDAAHKFFALPEEQKMDCYIGNSQKSRGFSPLYGEHGDREIYGKQTGNLSEAFDIGYEIAGDRQKGPNDILPPDNFNLYGGNQENLPGFKETYLSYFGEVLEPGRRLIKIFALALGLSEDYFDSTVRYPGCTSRLMHYPPQPVPGEEQVGIAIHTSLLTAEKDYECFTIFSQDAVPALQVLNANGHWVACPPIPGTFVNIGDFFAFWTNGIFKSTLHRAINLTGKERYSIPFFLRRRLRRDCERARQLCNSRQPGQVWACQGGEYVRKQLANTYVKYGEKVSGGKKATLSSPSFLVLLAWG